MNAHAKIPTEIVEPEETALAVITTDTALEILTNQEKFDAFYERVKAATDTLVPDVSTQKGRDAIRSMARKVQTTKAAIDKAGLGLTEEWRKNTATVNDSRRTITTKFDELRVEVRKPLTDWEAAEDAREAEVKGALERLGAAAVVSIEDTVAGVQERLDEILAVQITDEKFQEYAAAARATQEATATTLQAAVVRLTKEAEDREKLARLEAAEAERLAREAKEAEEREAKVAEEKAAAEAEQHRLNYVRDMIEHINQCGLGFIGGQPYAYAVLLRELETKVVIDERFGDRQAEVEKLRVDTLAQLQAAMTKDAEEAERRAERDRADATKRAAEEAAARAREESDTKARAEQAEKERQHQAELARSQAETKRLQDEQAERDRQAAAEKEAADKRAKDREHRGLIMGEAKVAIMACGGVEEEVAKKIVMAIVANEIPHTSIAF